MKIKSKYSIIDIVGISLVFIVLVILVIPVVLMFTMSMESDTVQMKALALLNTAENEYEKDTSIGRTITSYCYRSDYGYPKTLNDSTVKSIKDTEDGISYYITFDELGNIISLVYSDGKYALDIKDNVVEELTKELKDKDFIDVEDALVIINKCPYNSN